MSNYGAQKVTVKQIEEVFEISRKSSSGLLKSTDARRRKLQHALTSNLVINSFLEGLFAQVLCWQQEDMWAKPEPFFILFILLLFPSIATVHCPLWQPKPMVHVAMGRTKLYCIEERSNPGIPFMHLIPLEVRKDKCEDVFFFQNIWLLSEKASSPTNQCKCIELFGRAWWATSSIKSWFLLLTDSAALKTQWPKVKCIIPSVWRRDGLLLTLKSVTSLYPRVYKWYSKVLCLSKLLPLRAVLTQWCEETHTSTAGEHVNSTSTKLNRLEPGTSLPWGTSANPCPTSCYWWWSFNGRLRWIASQWSFSGSIHSSLPLRVYYAVQLITFWPSSLRQ